MNGFSFDGIVDLGVFVFTFSKNCSITVPLGNRLKRSMVVTITAGMLMRYPVTPVEKYRITEKYVVKRTTELSASAVVISFVGTNLLHVS